MATNEEAIKKAKNQQTLQLAALVVLVHRAGDRVTLTESEHDEIVASFGGKTMMALHIEVVARKGLENEVQVSLIRKRAGNAELPS